MLMTYQLDPERTQLMDSPKYQYGQIWLLICAYLVFVINNQIIQYAIFKSNQHFLKHIYGDLDVHHCQLELKMGLTKH